MKSFNLARQQNTNKLDYGRVLVIAGSPGMAGAAILCAKAALKSGAGLVEIACNEKIMPILQTAVPEATCLPRDKSVIDLGKYQAIVYGPGLGTKALDDENLWRYDNRPNNRAIFQWILENYEGKLVVDADGLNMVAAHKIDLKAGKCDVILTPHEGEAERLLGYKVSNREKAVRDLAKIGDVALLKGYKTLICGKELTVNETGNPGMATAGSGDVLAGVIASFAAQGFNAENASVLGVRIHGRAGDLAAEKLGQAGLNAMDIVDSLGLAIKELE
ncbi:MAG: NAD(P)H-hydrate dehydratase [Clostridia bacterium]|nr:NAD(P)H-hydrate dehydratase [Clostridia bacterium]